MNNLLSQKLISIRFLDRILYKLKLHKYSTQAAVQIQDNKNEREVLKDYERLSNISIKRKIKKPQRAPFVKNLFLGVYDTEILTYPQLEKEELENLNQQVKPVEDYFQKLSPQAAPISLSNDFFENLRQLRLFGLQCSQLLNARELNVTENCRFNDVICSSTSSAPTLVYNDLLGIQAISKNGTEEQKKKYLPELIAGSKLAAFCILENDLKNVALFNTTATPTDDEKSWILNGEKSCVINGNISDLLIVIARTEFLTRTATKESKLTVFMVDKNAPGISTQKREVLGINQTDICDIKFNNTPVSNDNVLGKANEGDSVLSSLLTEFRLNTGIASSALSRQLLNKLADFCVHTNCGEESIAKFDYVCSNVSQIASSLYATESMIYLTTGLLDQYENQDCEAESAIVKVFSSEEAHRSVLRSMELIGAPAYSTDHWCNIYLRDILGHMFLNETNKNLKMNIAVLGLRHAGVNIQDKIKILRNPLFYPKEIFKRMWTQRRQAEDNPRLTLGLQNYLHPSLLQPATKCLEYSVLRLEYATEIVLARHGAEIINAHMDLERLADCVIDIYAMTAVLGRASRSYCIGLQHAEYEMMLAITFCVEAVHRVKEKVRLLQVGPYVNSDENFKKIAGQVFKFHKYFPVHPLTRNF